MPASSLRSATRLSLEFAAFLLLLFVARYVARGHLVVQIDQECHIGAIAVDVLEHGVRFPLLAYAPNEYDNGSFFSGLLTTISFTLLGRNALALKLVTLCFAAMGAVATLALLRFCLDELGLMRARVRQTSMAALVIALALAPRVVTLASLHATANHAEGSAIDTVLLALFGSRWHTRSTLRCMLLWAAVGFSLYLNKGTVLVIPILAAAEIVLSWRSRRRLPAAFAGFILGELPELLTIIQRQGMGWATMAFKAERGSQNFPWAFIQTVLNLGEYRVELLATWAVAIGFGVVLLARCVRTYRQAPTSRADSRPQLEPMPLTLAMVLGVTFFHLIGLSTMAKNGLDVYVTYAYPTLVVLYAVLVASLCLRAVERWGEGGATWVGVGILMLTVVLYRPDALTLGFGRISSLWHNQPGASCFWRFAEGFEREHTHGLVAPGQTREQHAVERCRSFSNPDHALECIGGIARELHWRHQGSVDAPPPELTDVERRSYAYFYGTHRKGRIEACADFKSPELQRYCEAAVQTECLVFADAYTRIASGSSIARPSCAILEPPMNGYWAMMRADLLNRSDGSAPNLSRARGDDDLTSCKRVLDTCY